MPQPLVRKLKETIVVADDDHTVVLLVGELLRKKGFQAVAAYDAMQVMQMARQYNPRAVILDLGMPGGSGMDVLKKLKLMSTTKQIPVLILTGSLEPKVAKEARSLGACEFLTKPVDLKALYEALLRALGRPPEPDDPAVPTT
jgi:DNA-binding response OmpR family regulator